MLPHGYEQPAALVLLLGGVLACFAGYRLFRVVLGIYGFILGAMIASSVIGASNTMGMVIAALVGGLIGSVVLVFAWFVGVALVGAGIGVLVAHLIWTGIGAGTGAGMGSGNPPAIAVVIVAIAGAVAAMFIQRYVIIVGTAFAGAWTILLAVANAFPAQGLMRGSSATEVWILYPTSVPSRWASIAWLGLGVLGTAVQLSTTTGRKR